MLHPQVLKRQTVNAIDDFLLQGAAPLSSYTRTATFLVWQNLAYLGCLLLQVGFTFLIWQVGSTFLIWEVGFTFLKWQVGSTFLASLSIWYIRSCGRRRTCWCRQRGVRSEE